MKEKEMNGFLDSGTMFKGDLVFEDLLRIDGKFEGTIRSESTLIVGESADVKGDLHVDSVIINGRLDGTISAKTRVEVNNRAKVKGEINTPALCIQEGAVFDGKINMSKPVSTAPAKEQVKEKVEAEKSKGK